jgi:hypothetical protein
MKGIKRFFKSDFFLLLCIIIAACGLIGGCMYADIFGGSEKVAAIVAVTQLGWLLPMPFHF